MFFLVIYLSLLALALLGVAILVSLRMVYGPGGGNDIVERVLTLTGWLAIVGGVSGSIICTLGASSLVFITIALLVASMVWVYYQRSEHQVLMHLLGSAAMRGLPLQTVAGAYGSERNSGLGLKADLLADHLRKGHSFTDSLRAAGIHNSPDLEVATRVGEELGLLGILMHDATQRLQDPAAELRRSLHKLFYLALILIMLGAVITFVMRFIVPSMQQMFVIFGLNLPPLTQIVLDVASVSVSYWLWGIPLMLFVGLGMLCATAGFIGLLPVNFPFVNRFSRRFDQAQILLILSRTMDAGISVGQTVESLARNHPRTVVRARLQLALEALRAGSAWTAALRYAGIINGSEEQLLEAAEQADNTSWALRHSATGGIRRFDYRLRCALGIGFPLVLLFLAFLVGIIVVVIFLPLPTMIQGLS